MGDEEAVRRVRDGDRDAYRLLVDRYASMVFAVARRYCDAEAEVEDLAQDVFVRAYEALGEFRGEASFSSWLYRIAVNRGRDHVKSAHRSSTADEAAVGAAEGGFEGTTGRVSTPEEDLHRAELARKLQWALGQLTPEYAVPFLLRYERQLSYAEMASMLDVTPGALKVRVHRARNELRNLLEDER